MNDDDVVAARASGRETVEELRRSGALDALFERLDAGEVEMTGSQGLLPALLKEALERGLTAELTEHLGYEKGQTSGQARSNTRNGTTKKTVMSEVGAFEIEVPRDRAGSFTPRLVRKGQRRLDGLDSMIISLYAGGMTVRDIRHHLASTLGVEVSAGTISTITDAVCEAVLEWQHRPLEAFYPVIYLDAIRIKVRRDHRVENRAAHLAVGVDMEGVKHVLGIWVQADEGASFWAHVCAELANRGVRDVLIVCCDGLAGLPEARACQFFCVWGLEVGGDSVGVGGGELGEGLFPVGGGVSLDEAGVSCSFVGGFSCVCEALGGSFVFDVADGEP